MIGDDADLFLEKANNTSTIKSIATKVMIRIKAMGRLCAGGVGMAGIGGLPFVETGAGTDEIGASGVCSADVIGAGDASAIGVTGSGAGAGEAWTSG